MRRTTLFTTLAIGSCLLTALSCSGGGGGGTGITGATAKVSVSAGAVTAKGSVDLNGKKYETPHGTSYTYDGQPGSFADLKVGMVVTVNGSLSSSGVRTAATVTQEDVVEGAIQDIPASDRIVVLGQTVLIDEGTLFDSSISPPNISGLVVGNLVEVNGFVTGKGLIRATLIEKKTPPPTCEVKGIVENHNNAVQSFTIGGLTVNYNGADTSDMPSSSWNDLLVEVKGSPCDQGTVTMNATKVEPEGIDVANADEIEVEGAITLFNSSERFTVNGVPVVTNGNTIFEGGVPGDLALGVEVEVEGSLVNGVLTAKEVSFRDNVEIEGDAASVTADDLTVTGLPGITVVVTAQTEFKGGISSMDQLFIEDHVRVKGRPSGTNTVIAAEVDKRSPDTRVILEGPVQSIANPTVTVLGFPIDTSLISDGNFKGSNGVPNGRVAFFSAVKVGSLIKARGDLNGGVVVWNEIQLQGDDD
jgi:uncharacterized Zn-binding protein involved in type VI secretion